MLPSECSTDPAHIMAAFSETVGNIQKGNAAPSGYRVRACQGLLIVLINAISAHRRTLRCYR